MQLHCIYCGAKLPVEHILYDRESDEIKAQRLAFELEHERCGPKALGMVLDID